jgi:hypothetical protein
MRVDVVGADDLRFFVRLRHACLLLGGATPIGSAPEFCF